MRLRTDKLIWQQLPEEVIALSLERSEYLSVNRAGIELWELLSKGTTIKELAARLAERWQIDIAQAERDVCEFLTELSQAGLLEPGAP